MIMTYKAMLPILPSSCILLVSNIYVTIKIYDQLCNDTTYTALINFPAVYIIWGASILNFYRGIVDTTLFLNFLLTTYFAYVHDMNFNRYIKNIVLSTAAAYGIGYLCQLCDKMVE